MSDSGSLAPYPPSPAIREIAWGAASSIVRQASGSDCWPATWGDDDRLYTAYGGGWGFEPKTPEKLSSMLRRLAPALRRGHREGDPKVNVTWDTRTGKGSRVRLEIMYSEEEAQAHPV